MSDIVTRLRRHPRPESCQKDFEREEAFLIHDAADEIALLRAALREVQIQCRCALGQSIPSDDPLIMGRVRLAEEAAWRGLEARS